MIAEFSPITALVTVLFGAAAGGMTNAVAIWMLFHPHEPRGIPPLRLQGAIPKNKARLATTIGRTVGQRLLSAEDLTRQLAAPGMREAFERAVRALAQQLLDTERRSLREELPADLVQELERSLRDVAGGVADRVTDYVAGDGFRGSVERFLVRLRDEYADRPVGDLLTAARREAIRERVESWVTDAVESPQLDQTIRDWLERQVGRLAADATPLLERLPADLVAALEREVAGYLPVAIDRLAALLADPDARARIQRALHELFQRFIRDLLLHERIVARLVVTEKTFARLLDNVEREGVEQLSLLLDEPAMRDQVAKSINDAVVNFLRRPLAEHAERLGPERLTGITDTAARHIVSALRDPTTRGYAVDRLDQALQAAEQRTWGDLLSRLPPERAAGWLADAARSPQVTGWVRDGIASALHRLLDRPIGRPAALLPDGATDRLAQRLSPVLWQWIQHQVPELVARVDVQTMVEQKILSFSLERMEQIVRATTQRELDLIVRLGYVLGALVGAVAYVVTLLVS